MAPKENNKPVVLQVLPELNQGGVELGTIEIASELQKRGIKKFCGFGGRTDVAAIGASESQTLYLAAQNQKYFQNVA